MPLTKRWIIHLIKFAFDKKKIPVEITDLIDLGAYVTVEPASAETFEKAPTREQKWEIVSEVYWKNIQRLIEAYPLLKEYFEKKEYAPIDDMRRWVASLHNTLIRAEAGEAEALEILETAGYTLEEFKRYVESEEEALRKMEEELKPKKPPRPKIRATRAAMKRLVTEKLKTSFISYLAGAGIDPATIEKEYEQARPDIDSLVEEVLDRRMIQPRAVELVQSIARDVVARLKPPVIVPPRPPETVMEVYERYWPEIIEKGLYAFLEDHPELGVEPIKKNVDLFIKVAWQNLRWKRPATIREWIVTQSPYAKPIIEVLLSEGIYSPNFMRYFEEAFRLVQADLEKALTEPITVEQFFEMFRQFLAKQPPFS